MPSLHAVPPAAAEGIPEPEFARYREVVNGAYRLLDLLLGRLLALAGSDATVLVVSDHGFHAGARRPRRTPAVAAGIAAWHRPTGVLAMRGPALRADELVHGAGLLDVAPTVLALSGLPAGDDLEGRVIAEAFQTPPDLARIPTWENAPGDSLPSPAPAPGLSPVEAAALSQQFAAIGYLPATAADPGEEAADCLRENRWNLARALLDAGRPEAALPLLESVYAERPERGDFGLELANVQLALGLDAEADATLAETLAGHEETPGAKFVLGGVAHRRGDWRHGLQLLREAAATAPDLPGLSNLLGLTLIRLGRPAEAEEAFRRTLAGDPDDPQAHLGVAHTLLRRGEPARAAESALTALGLKWNHPLAHFILGRALVRLGEDARAIQAFENCLRLSPGYVHAHRFLATLHARQPGGAAAARHHRARTARAGRAVAVAARDHTERLRAGVAERARVRAAARRETASPSSPVPWTLPADLPEILVVSGPPRSGTSLMMRMLGAAGVPLLTDDARPADEDNPDGYFEWAPLERLGREPALIIRAAGRALKVVSPLLPCLPRGPRYRVIFMRRLPAEVAASQLRMRRRREGEASDPRPDPGQLATWLESHVEAALAGLRAQSGVLLHEVVLSGLVHEPARTAAVLAAFLGSGWVDRGAPDRMAAVTAARSQGSGARA